MEEIMCDYSLEHYRSRPAQLGEKYETHQFESRSIGFIAPGDAGTAICMACDTKLRLEGIPEMLQRRLGVSATENVTFTRLEAGPHHDGVRFANGAEVTLQELGPGVTGYVDDLLSSVVWRQQTVDAM
jgi:hypothetical protein